jgi:hypothetical protein
MKDLIRGHLQAATGMLDHLDPILGYDVDRIFYLYTSTDEKESIDAPEASRRLSCIKVICNDRAGIHKPANALRQGWVVVMDAINCATALLNGSVTVEGQS